jgi:hypothetical protein
VATLDGVECIVTDYSEKSFSCQVAEAAQVSLVNSVIDDAEIDETDDSSRRLQDDTTTDTDTTDDTTEDTT